VWWGGGEQGNECPGTGQQNVGIISLSIIISIGCHCHWALLPLSLGCLLSVCLSSILPKGKCVQESVIHCLSHYLSAIDIVWAIVVVKCGEVGETSVVETVVW